MLTLGDFPVERMGAGALSGRAVKTLAGFIPKELRLELFRLVYTKCGSSPTATARVVGINPRQVYFYLPSRTGKIRNFPGDETTARILKAALKVNRGKTLKLLKRASKRFSRLAASL